MADDRSGTEARRETPAVSDEGPRRDYAPVGEERKPTTFATLKRTFTEFSEDNMTDWAAALTYYGLFSIFPALTAFVGIIGFFVDPATATQAITDIVSGLSPTAADTFAAPIENATSNPGASGIIAIAGIALALWSASGYVGAFMRASNIIYETPEGRPFIKKRPIQMLTTLVMLILAVFVVIALVLTGPVVEAVAAPLGIGSTAVTIYQYAKWPILIAIVALMFVALYYAAPNVQHPGLKSVMPGAVFALVVWILASVAFAFYVANFGSYGATYGSLGGIIAFLTWLWVTNCAVLLGAEMNAERERSREIAAGVPRAEREIQLEPRDAPKEQKTT